MRRVSDKQMANLIFDRSSKNVIVDDHPLDIQELYDKARDFENRSLNTRAMISAIGKDDLGSGVKTTLTVTLLDGWLVRFITARDDGIYFTGGTLVAIGKEGRLLSPLAPIVPLTNRRALVQHTRDKHIMEFHNSALEER